MIVGFTFDAKTDYVRAEKDPIDASAEFDKPENIEAIARAIESAGHTLKRIGNVHNLLKQIDDLAVDIVFNIAEGLGSRNRESQVPLLLELYNIPYVGADSLTQALTLDKIMAKKVFQAEGIPTPRFKQLDNVEEITNDLELNFPIMVKLRHEGSSKGLDERNIVRNIDELRKQATRLIKDYSQSVLAEEFISGTEFTVGIIGNKSPKVYEPVQVSMDGNVDLGEKIYTFRRISSDSLQYVCPPKISPALKKELQAIALRVYRAVDCLDFGRVDFRVDEQGNPFVLEINPLPSLGLDDIFPIIAKNEQIDYNKIINRILDAALLRHKLIEREEVNV